MINRRPNNQMQVLAEQRGRLLERIAQQRSTLRVQWVPVHQALAKGDQALLAAADARRYVQAHRATFSLALAVTCAALVLVKPRRSLKLLKTGFVLWRGWRMVQSSQVWVPSSLPGRVLKLIRQRYFPAAFR